MDNLTPDEILAMSDEEVEAWAKTQPDIKELIRCFKMITQAAIAKSRWMRENNISSKDLDP